MCQIYTKFSFFFICAITFVLLYAFVKLNMPSIRINRLETDYEYSTKYVFIDLGANKGDSILNFFDLNEKAHGGKISNQIDQRMIKNNKWIVHAFEGNPVFDRSLGIVANKITNMGHQVYMKNSTVGWIYDGNVEFYIDTVNPKFESWGSSLMR